MRSLGGLELDELSDLRAGVADGIVGPQVGSGSDEFHALPCDCTAKPSVTPINGR